MPLCVDLDGTLIKTDVVWESLVLLLRHRPLSCLAVPLWLLFGRAYLKAQLAKRVQLDPALLPYNQPLLEFLRGEKSRGRTVLLVTAADSLLARCVAEYVGLFDSVMASDGKRNLRGKYKGARLVERFGERGFDYAGNSSVDLAVWRHARQAIVVNARPRLSHQAAQLTSLGRVFDPKPPLLSPLARSLHLFEWLKNLVLFVPALLSGSASAGHLAANAALGFIAFSLSASFVCLLRALLSLNTDRQEQERRLWPFASGDLPLPIGLGTLPVLLGGIVVTTSKLSWEFAVLLVLYTVTLGYSRRLKPKLISSSFAFAALYTLRLSAGCVAAGVGFSLWTASIVFCGLLVVAAARQFSTPKAA